MVYNEESRKKYMDEKKLHLKKAYLIMVKYRREKLLEKFITNKILFDYTQKRSEDPFDDENWG